MLSIVCIWLAELGGKQLVVHSSTMRAQVPIHHAHEPHYVNLLVAEGVNGSSHPAQGEVSGGGASLAQASVGQGL